MIRHGDFQKLDLRIGKVISSVRVEGTDKLIKLEIDLGSEKRQIVAGMAEFSEPDYLLRKLIPILDKSFGSSRPREDSFQCSIRCRLEKSAMPSRLTGIGNQHDFTLRVRLNPPVIKSPIHSLSAQ